MMTDSPTGKIAGLYDLLETLGSGHFAVVKLARHVFTGAKVAVKVVDKTKLDEVSKAHLFQEVRCMKLVQHPNVVRLYEVIDTQTKLYLVLELGDGGDLYDYIMKHDGGLSEDLARKYFRQILRAITYCHQLHVVHRDLKPENVVFFEKLGVVKLTDFGFSNKFSPGQKLETFCGSLAYSAPEILLGDSYDAPAVDIWSLGVILYMLVCGQPPFEKANDSETLTMIMDCKYTVPPQISEECRKLIGSMLVRDPRQRASLAEIAKCPWLAQNSGDEPTGDSMPLISRQQLSEEDHAFIIQKMINGHIASKEEITQSLDKKKYNHITATYFLLAEIRLRKQREEALKQLKTTDSGQMRSNSKMVLDDNKLKPAEANKVSIVPISINVSAPVSNTDTGKSDKRSRKCSIVREEDEDESAFEHTDGGNELCVAVNRRESISDGRLNRSVQERTGGVQQQTQQQQIPPSPIPVIVQNAHTKMVVSVDATLAQKLNQIDDPISMSTTTQMIPHSLSTHTSPTFANKTDEHMQDTIKGLKELEIGKLKPFPSGGKNPVLTHRRSKLNKIRTPSCSSSEASDDDTKTRNKKKLNKFCSDTPTRFRMNRRDSYDDSSDSQDQAFSSGSRGHAANFFAASNSNVNSNKKDGQSQGRDQKQTDDTRKSSHSSHKNKKQPKDTIEASNRHLLASITDKSQSLSAIISAGKNRRRRVRESQSLDRITEAQEYELRHRHHTSEPHVVYEQRYSLFNLSSFSVAETKEEYDDVETNLEDIKTNTENVKNALNLTDINYNKRNEHNIFNISSIKEIDVIMENRKLTTATTKATKCFVTIKKIRRLGKYFPVVNFS